MQILEERTNGGDVARYLNGPGIDHVLAQVAGPTTTFFLEDHLGSVVRATNTLGASVLARDYDPWGNPLQGAATSGYAFTGREWDAETGTYYYRARYYQPSVGRFLSEDPRIGWPPGGRYRGDLAYAYVGNEPVAWRDPSGLIRWNCKIGLAGGGKAGVGGFASVACTSECAWGKRVTAKLAGTYVGGALQVSTPTAVPDIDFTTGEIPLYDPYAKADAQHLQGYFGAMSVGFAFGPGLELFSKIVVGEASGAELFSYQSGWAWPGISSVVGAVALVSTSESNCACEGQ